MTLASQADHHGFLIMPRDERIHFCASTTNVVRPEDYGNFLADRDEYSIEQLKKRVPEKYHSVIEVFPERGADILSPHRAEDHDVQLVDYKSGPQQSQWRCVQSPRATSLRCKSCTFALSLVYLASIVF